MRWFLGILAALVVCSAAFVGWGLTSLADLAAAARRGDAQQMMSRTDVARVRHAFVEQILEAYLRKIGETRQVRPFERMAINTFGAGIADELVGKLMTQDNLAALLQTGKARSDADVGAMVPMADIELSNLSTSVRRLVFVKPVEFSFRLGEDREAGSISMHLDGSGWRLSAVNLPSRIVDRLVERLPVRRGAAGP